jgi:tRNA nucleotidyltransferase (CCA-adding enzyme)
VFEQRRQVGIILDTIQQKLKRGLEIRHSEIYRWFHGLTVELLLYLAARANREEVRRFTSLYMTRLRMVRCSLDGNALKAMGVPAGPEIGRIKEKLLIARLDGDITTDQEELEWAQRLISSFEFENGMMVSSIKKEDL